MNIRKGTGSTVLLNIIGLRIFALGLVLTLSACEDDFSSSPAENLLMNASFEEGREHWRFLEPGEIVDGSAHARSGNKVLKITVDPETWVERKGYTGYRIHQDPKGLQPGEQLTFSVWVRTNNLEGNGTVPVLLKAWTGPNTWESFFVPSLSTRLTGTNAWQKYTDTFVLPADFNGRLQVICFPINNQSGEVYYDDLQLRKAM